MADERVRGRGELESGVLGVPHASEATLTLSEVQHALGHDLAYATVMTVPSRLHGKGVLERERRGRAYGYRPVSDRPGLVARRMGQVLDSSPERDTVRRGIWAVLDDAERTAVVAHEQEHVDRTPPADGGCAMLTVVVAVGSVTTTYKIGEPGARAAGVGGRPDPLSQPALVRERTLSGPSAPAARGFRPCRRRARSRWTGDMIERDLDVPAGIAAYRVVGRVSRRDLMDFAVPFLDAAVREHRRPRLLCVVDEDFSAITPAALWEDLRLAPSAVRHLAGCAVVSDLSCVRESVRMATFFLTAGHYRVFPTAERDTAISWLADLPAALADVRLHSDEGVVVAEIEKPLRREDVHQIAGEVDDWLATHAELPGLVVHARTFPGWENVSGLLDHLWFVGGHQGRIGRVALVVPGGGVELASWVAGALLHPEVACFADVDDAIRWAAVAPVRVG